MFVLGILIRSLDFSRGSDDLSDPWNDSIHADSDWTNLGSLEFPFNGFEHTLQLIQEILPLREIQSRDIGLGEDLLDLR